MKSENRKKNQELMKKAFADLKKKIKQDPFGAILDLWNDTDATLCNPVGKSDGFVKIPKAVLNRKILRERK